MTHKNVQARIFQCYHLPTSAIKKYYGLFIYIQLLYQFSTVLRMSKRFWDEPKNHVRSCKLERRAGVSSVLRTYLSPFDAVAKRYTICIENPHLISTLEFFQTDNSSPAHGKFFSWHQDLIARKQSWDHTVDLPEIFCKTA